MENQDRQSRPYDELPLPCPFCGMDHYTAIIIDDDLMPAVTCTLCNVTMRGRNARLRWNTRDGRPPEGAL